VASDRFVKASAKPIENLANALARQVGRPVIDRTGLTGNFDYNLEWSPDLSATPAPDVSGAPANGGVPLVTALQEQLGLKLDSSRGPNQVIVIDHLDHPTPD
jgi:bla regulator protein blaR1